MTDEPLRRSARLAKIVAATRASNNEDVNAHLATDVSTLERLHNVHKKLQDEEYFNRCVAKGGSTDNVLKEILKYNKWRESGRKKEPNRGTLVKNLKYIFKTSEYKNATEDEVRGYSIVQLISFARFHNPEYQHDSNIRRLALAEELIGEHFTRDSHSEEEDSEEGEDESDWL
mmetsp:Transcript_18486/g.27868  ORF Transcript_18486/g.27868 Transcript_18486/m.27868 type:complete len:173 (+) Transcript_18486:54-572(+)